MDVVVIGRCNRHMIKIYYNYIYIPSPAARSKSHISPIYLITLSKKKHMCPASKIHIQGTQRFTKTPLTKTGVIFIGLSWLN